MKKRWKRLTVLIGATAVITSQLGVTAFAGQANSTPLTAVAGTETASQEIATAKAALEAAQATVNEKKSLMDSAQEKISQGSLGFFQYMAGKGSTSASAAVKVLTSQSVDGIQQFLRASSSDNSSWQNFKSYTNIGDQNDATSLENMKAAIDMLYECNSLRTTDNNFSAGSLKVNDVLMAAAQMNANWAVLKSGFNYNSHARVFNVAENLAWYPNSWSPFDGWYTEEKALYDSGNNTYSEVGHYINMTNPSYSITGYGIRNSAEMTRYSSHAQDFDGSSGSYGESYTVDEYKARFMEYYNSLYNAEQTYNAAVANRDALQAYYDKLLELNGITDSSVLTTTTAAIATTTTQGTSAEAPSVVNFNLYGKDTIPAATMTAIAGKNVTLSVAVDANTLVTIDGNQLALSDASAVKLISGSAADGKASLSVRSNNLDTQKTVTIYYYFGADKAGSQAALYFVNGDNSLLEFRTSAVYENGYAAFTAPLVNANYEISLK